MKPLYLLIIFVLISCKSEPKIEPVSSEYKAEMSTYFKKLKEGRVNYLELVGLHKLKNGPNTFGKSKDNSIVIDCDISEHIGTITKTDSILELTINNNVKVTTENDSIVSTSSLSLDQYGSTKLFYHNSIYWQVITRSGELYLRVWDKNNSYIETFKGFDNYTLNENFKIKGVFEYFEKEKNEEVKTQLGVNTLTKFIGKVTFTFNGSTHSLDVGFNGFTMVSDATSGYETYGGGRYFYLDLPKVNGEIEIDFNKLYNPPCAFSDYTTCPYPPRQNVLSFKIEAGEKYKK